MLLGTRATSVGLSRTLPVLRQPWQRDVRFDQRKPARCWGAEIVTLGWQTRTLQAVQ